MDHRPFVRSVDLDEKALDVLIANRVNEVERRNLETRDKNLAAMIADRLARTLSGKR